MVAATRQQRPALLPDGTQRCASPAPGRDVPTRQARPAGRHNGNRSTATGLAVLPSRRHVDGPEPLGAVGGASRRVRRPRPAGLDLGPTTGRRRAPGQQARNWTRPPGTDGALVTQGAGQLIPQGMAGRCSPVAATTTPPERTTVQLSAGRLFLAGLIATVAWAAHSVANDSSTAAATVPGVSQAAIDAYTNAANSAPAGCGIRWTLLAGIGAVETGHGTYGGSTLDSTGTATPPIRGPQLDGGQFALVLDTDRGELDGDTTYDRAVGPMQFIPATWAAYGHGNPQNINNAAHATAALLCAVATKAGHPITDPATEEAAIRAYNNSDEYVAQVRAFATDFANLGTELHGDGVTLAAVAQKLGIEGRHRWEDLDRVLRRTPGDKLDSAYAALDPTAQLIWSTLDRDGIGNAAALSASSNGPKIVAAAETWVGKDFHPGTPAQCALFVRQVLKDASVTLTPESTKEPLDQWASGGPAVANSFGSDQGLKITRVADLRPGDIVMFANTYDDGSGWPEGTITHVAIVVEVRGPKADDVTIVDRPTASAPVKRRPLSTFEHFAGGIRP